MRDRERWCLGQGVGTLPRWFTGVDGQRPILASRVAALLRTVATALRRRVINVSAVALIDAGVFQEFAFWAEIAILFGHVGKLVDAIEVRRRSRIFFYPDVSSDATLIEPLQKFAVAVGRIRRQSLRQLAINARDSVRSCRGSLHFPHSVVPGSLAPPR